VDVRPGRTILKKSTISMVWLLDPLGKPVIVYPFAAKGTGIIPQGVANEANYRSWEIQVRQFSQTYQSDFQVGPKCLSGATFPSDCQVIRSGRTTR
jgi:hypothetical protein